MRQTMTAEKRKVSAFTANAIREWSEQEEQPESAGPDASARLSIVPESALAAARSSSGTTEGVMASRPGSTAR